MEVHPASLRSASLELRDCAELYKLPRRRKGQGALRMSDERLQHFLLFEMDDDWLSLGEFAYFIRRISPAGYTRRKILDVISELAQSGYLRFGGWSMASKTWAPWEVSEEVAMDRITNGYPGEPGVLDATDEELSNTEIFRADITDKGLARLAELGNPYEKYGNPWESDPTKQGRGNYPPWVPQKR